MANAIIIGGSRGMGKAISDLEISTKLEADVIILMPVFLYPRKFEFLSNNIEPIVRSTLFSVRALTSIGICSGSGCPSIQTVVIVSYARASGRENGTTEGVTEYFKFYRLPYLQPSG